MKLLNILEPKCTFNSLSTNSDWAKHTLAALQCFALTWLYRCNLVELCCAAVRSAQFCCVCVGQVDFLANETDIRVFSTVSEENTRRGKSSKDGGREVREKKYNQGADGYLRVDTDFNILDFQHPIKNHLLTVKHFNLTIFMPQKSKKLQESSFPTEMYSSQGGKGCETGFRLVWDMKTLHWNVCCCNYTTTSTILKNTFTSLAITTAFILQLYVYVFSGNILATWGQRNKVWTQCLHIFTLWFCFVRSPSTATYLPTILLILMNVALHLKTFPVEISLKVVHIVTKVAVINRLHFMTISWTFVKVGWISSVVWRCSFLFFKNHQHTRQLIIVNIKAAGGFYVTFLSSGLLVSEGTNTCSIYQQIETWISVILE